jgi:hypothetical protein
VTQGRKIREDHKILQIADCSLQLANGHDSVINLTVYGACPLLYGVSICETRRKVKKRPYSTRDGKSEKNCVGY